RCTLVEVERVRSLDHIAGVAGKVVRQAQSRRERVPHDSGANGWNAQRWKQVEGRATDRRLALKDMRGNTGGRHLISLTIPAEPQNQGQPLPRVGVLEISRLLVQEVVVRPISVEASREGHTERRQWERTIEERLRASRECGVVERPVS